MLSIFANIQQTVTSETDFFSSPQCVIIFSVFKNGVNASSLGPCCSWRRVLTNHSQYSECLQFKLWCSMGQNWVIICFPHEKPENILSFNYGYVCLSWRPCVFCIFKDKGHLCKSSDNNTRRSQTALCKWPVGIVEGQILTWCRVTGSVAVKIVESFDDKLVEKICNYPHLQMYLCHCTLTNMSVEIAGWRSAQLTSVHGGKVPCCAPWWNPPVTGIVDRQVFEQLCPWQKVAYVKRLIKQ